MEKTKYLAHFGITGMKWGQRRFQNEDGTLTPEGKRRYNQNYSEEQRYRDRRVYGRGAVRRINRDMNSGVSISGARSFEADRINSARRKSRLLGQVGSVAGGVAGFLLTKPAMNLFNKYTHYKYSNLLKDPMIQLTVSGGMSMVGTQLGRYGGQSAGMITSGYSPQKFR